MDGEGIIVFPTGHKIKANFKQGGICDRVIIEFSNGDVYDG